MLITISYNEGCEIYQRHYPYEVVPSQPDDSEIYPKRFVQILVQKVDPLPIFLLIREGFDWLIAT